MKQEDSVPIKEWIEMLSPFLAISTIKKYYRNSRGSETKLYLIYLKYRETEDKRKRFKRLYNLIKLKRNIRSSRCIANNFSSQQGVVQSIQNIKRNGGSYRIAKKGDDIEVTLYPKDKITIYIKFGEKELKKFKSFFNDIHHYFSDVGGDKDIIELENILQEYYKKYLEIKALKKQLNKDSIYEEESIKNILQQVRSLLYITGNELYKELPNTIKIKAIPTLNKEIIAKIEKLNLQLDNNITYPMILEMIRKL